MLLYLRYGSNCMCWLKWIGIVTSSEIIPGAFVSKQNHFWLVVKYKVKTQAGHFVNAGSAVSSCCEVWRLIRLGPPLRPGKRHYNQYHLLVLVVSPSFVLVSIKWYKWCCLFSRIFRLMVETTYQYITLIPNTRLRACLWKNYVSGKCRCHSKQNQRLKIPEPRYERQRWQRIVEEIRGRRVPA